MPPGIPDASIAAGVASLGIILLALGLLIGVAGLLRWIAPVKSAAMPNSYEADETDWSNVKKKER